MGLGALFGDYTLRTVALGAATLGLVSGVLGTFAVLRRQSLLGDAMSHAALPGIVVAFMLTGSKAPLVLLAGAFVSGWLAALLVAAVVRTTRLQYDTALAMLLAVFFGLGLMLLTWVQKHGGANQAGLDRFLFGQAAALMTEDVQATAWLTAVALALVILFWRPFKMLSFDPEYARTNGLPVAFFDALLTTLLVLAIVLGLQTVGVVLMSAMIVAPAAAARQWTDSLGKMVALAAFFGALSGAAGALVSFQVARLPTGPVIVVCASAIVAASLLLAPNRGLLWQRLGERRNRAQLRDEGVLLDLFELQRQHEDASHGHEAGVLQAMRPGGHAVISHLRRLAERGLAVERDGRWALTEQGGEMARRLSAEREGGV